MDGTARGRGVRSARCVGSARAVAISTDLPQRRDTRLGQGSDYVTHGQRDLSLFPSPSPGSRRNIRRSSIRRPPFGTC